MQVGSKFKSLPRQAFCHFCGEQKPNLPICNRCEMVHYCSRTHQIADHPYHKANCRYIAQCIEKVSHEAEQLRNVDWGADPYGKFFIIPETRAYMFAQMRLATAMCLFDTPDAVNAQVELLLKMSWLGRRDDGLYLRTIIPGLMLRLGKDQECYDFVKWWGTTPVNSPCFDDIYLPYLDLKGSNAFENYGWIFSSSSLELPMVVALLLLKIRLYLDIKLIQRAFPPYAGTTGSPSQANQSQHASDKPIEAVATQDNTQETPVVQKAVENESAVAQTGDESTTPQPPNRQTDAQQLDDMLFSEDAARNTKDTEKITANTAPRTKKYTDFTESVKRDETSGTKSQSLKPVSNAARIVPCLRSNIVIDHLEVIKDSNHTGMIAELETQISELYKIVHQLNARFWGDVSTFVSMCRHSTRDRADMCPTPQLLNPSKALAATTDFIDPGGMAESYSAVKFSRSSWYETPGAIEMICLFSKAETS
ncbi:hypothetical protein PpBr36_03444 [Pyricularia pennisetigena]|uniref:hypothetical protein n=1 Tax=Pyricularia pennisetigena TaxID=1578925 RepID=UPI0011502ACD|nr:hypothetical protein PpBr36_03444 [Pyricularia pennisetigena]TLS30535.1 hypothetical protein PpBr36_03444 [Pyricularia pennisetigena]